MSTTIVISVIISIIIFLIFRLRKNKRVVREKPLPMDLSQIQNLYQKREIKSFSIVGTYYLKLNLKEEGNFVGYAKCEKNHHDKYAVAVFKDSNKHIGYTPKENVKLSESIYAWHAGKVLAWGNLSYHEIDQSWLGIVYIPVGLSAIQIEKISESFELLNKRERIQNKDNITISEYFQLLDDHLKIKDNLKDLGNNTGIYYEFSKKIIPSLSKKLEAEKDWVNLHRLSNYKEIINELNEKFANTTLTRIEKAKKNLP